MHKKCEHGKQRYQCVDCGGQGICKHIKLRSHCRICKGSSRCEHDRQRSRCKDCKGASICEHGNYRYVCKGCGGKGLCSHHIQKNTCSSCRPEGAFKHYIRAALKRKYDFKITLEQFKALVIKPCHYCGEQGNPRGIDRRNNKMGYIFSNCYPCCKVCNYMKQNIDELTFISSVHKIASFYKKNYETL